MPVLRAYCAPTDVLIYAPALLTLLTLLALVVLLLLLVVYMLHVCLRWWGYS